jgi:hypothetical protein
MSNQSDRNPSPLLIKIEQRLFHLERKMDSIISMLQEIQNSGNPQAEKPFKQKSLLRTSPASSRSGSRKIEKRNERSREKKPDQKFYSRFSKQSETSGPRKKTFRSKPQKRK